MNNILALIILLHMGWNVCRSEASLASPAFSQLQPTSQRSRARPLEALTTLFLVRSPTVALGLNLRRSIHSLDSSDRASRLGIIASGASNHQPSTQKVSNLQWFVKTETFKPSLSFGEIRPHLEAHKVWVAQLRDEGKCITSGYRVDAQGKPGGGGLLFLAETDLEAAERLVLEDPLVANGCVDWQLNRWIPEVGDITLVDGGEWYAKRAKGLKG